jgi:hypothetical protein
MKSEHCLHRTNDDESIDLICRLCTRTIANAQNEDGFAEYAEAHVCTPTFTPQKRGAANQWTN